MNNTLNVEYLYYEIAKLDGINALCIIYQLTLDGVEIL